MKEKIIDAAIEEFTRNGLKFTMSDLAKRLGISKKTIYTVFDRKQALLIAIADRYGEDFGRMQEKMKSDASLNEVQKLERLLYELNENYPKPYWHLMKSVNHGWELVENCMKTGIEKGIIKEISIPVFMAMVKGTVHSFLQTSVLYENDLSYEQGKPKW